MTDINELIGPEPIPTPAPKFPTPWKSDRTYVVDATGAAVLGLNEFTHPGVTFDGWATLAQFIAEAVNEKIARDQATPPAPEFRYFRVCGNDYRVGPSGVELRTGTRWSLTRTGAKTLGGLCRHWAPYELAEITDPLAAQPA